MCCGRGHVIDDLIAGAIRQGFYSSGPSATNSYGTGYATKTYAEPEPPTTFGGLENALGDRQLVRYAVSVDKEGQVKGYLVEFQTPRILDERSFSSGDKHYAPEEQRVYDLSMSARPQELKEYEGGVRRLESENARQLVVPIQRLHRQAIKQLFGRPTKDAQPSYQQAQDYSASSALRNKIRQRKQQIGAERQLQLV